MKNTLVTLCLSAVLCGACCTETQQQASPFVQVEKGMFVRDGKPYKIYRCQLFGMEAFLLPKVKEEIVNAWFRNWIP